MHRLVIVGDSISPLGLDIPLWHLKMGKRKRKSIVSFLQEFSIPLIAGVASALVFANVSLSSYEHLIHLEPFAGLQIFGHDVTLHFIFNDIFMVFFFGIAAKEITESCLPGGSLNPFKKAISPLFATVGGVVGPIIVFFVGLQFLFNQGAFAGYEFSDLHRGWGIPTATDIALAWLVARTVFGNGHPAVNFLLLLAVADDAIGLAIIAIFYGNPAHPAEPLYLVLVLFAMGVAWTMRKQKIKSWYPYVLVAGPLAWSGLMLAQLHPALALVFIVPFLPGPKRDVGMFEEDENRPDQSPLNKFEHDIKLYVDLGLFGFAFANAGVPFADIGNMTWLVLGSLVVGKTVGIAFFGWLATKCGFPLPERMGMPELLMAGFVAALGLTVALFVAGAAFTDATLLGQAKMGALFSALVGCAAVLLGRALGMHKPKS